MSTGNATDSHLPVVAESVLFVGCGISVISILFTIIVYTANRYLRVKRQHMITINLCISLLIFYIGFILSLNADFQWDSSHDNHESNETHNVKIQPDCVAGTSLLLLGWFYVHSWILTHWIFLCLTIQQTAPRHISNFFIKVSLCTYVPASVPAIAIIIVDQTINRPLTGDIHCFLDLNKTVGHLFAVVTGIIFIAVVICTVFCTARLTCVRNPNAVASTLKKNRVHLVRLIMLSLIILLSHIPHLVLWLNRSPGVNPHDNVGLEIFDGIVVGLHGILIIFCLLYRGNRFCEYWSNVVSGRNPSQSASLRLSRLNISRSSKRGISSNTTEFTVEDSSTLDRKVEPRESNIMELTIDDEVFLSSTKNSKLNDVNRNNEIIKYPSVRIESTSSTDSKFDKKSDKYHTGSRARLNSFRRKVLRGSFRKSNKSSVSSMTNSPPPSPTMRKTSTLNRISIRDSNIFLAGDPDRKTSF